MGGLEETIRVFGPCSDFGVRHRREQRSLPSEEDRRPNDRDGLFPLVRGHVARNIEDLRAGRRKKHGRMAPPFARAPS